MQTPTKPELGQERNSLTKRQYVRFAFYQVDPVWRRLPSEEQATHKREFVETIETFNRRMLLRPYSLMGTRADAELLLWQIAETPTAFQDLAAAVMRTRLGAYLNLTYSYFSQTKRSIYEIRGDVNGGDGAVRILQSVGAGLDRPPRAQEERAGQAPPLPAYRRQGLKF